MSDLFYVKIRVEGVNLKRLVKKIYSSFAIKNLTFCSHKICLFETSVKNYKKIKKIAQDYNIIIEKRYKLEKIRHFLIGRIGYFVGALLLLCMLLINNFIIFNIAVYGSESIDKKEIIASLNNYGLNKGFANQINYTNVENFLKSEYDNISQVSIAKIGTHIIVNIKEKIIKMEQKTTDLVATENGLITSLKVYQGTAVKKIGDSVRVGEVIVKGEMMSGETKISVTPIAEVEGKVWYSHYEEYSDIQNDYVRTGKKIIQSNLEIFSKNVPTKQPKVLFDNYETETKAEYIFKNNFFPLVNNSTTYYELKQIQTEIDFDECKQIFLDKCIEKAWQKVPEGVIIIKTNDYYTKIDGGNAICVYLESNQSLI